MKSKRPKTKGTGRRRYVYLMERKTGRQLASVFGISREIKIGIAKNPAGRNLEVDRGIRGRVVLLEQYKVRDAFKVEAYLHRLYKGRNMRINAKPGAGGTEFFRLNPWQLARVRSYLKSQESGSDAFLYWFLLWVVLCGVYFFLTSK